jgi:hypothetical protein
LFDVQQLGNEFSGEPYTTLAATMSLLLLVMLLACLSGALGLGSASLREYRTYLVSAMIAFAFLIAFRLRLPNERHEDFGTFFLSSCCSASATPSPSSTSGDVPRCSATPELR